MTASNTKNKIIQTAFMLFLEQGFGSVSLSKIKDKAGISTGAFYHYFDSKEELIHEVMEHCVISIFKEGLTESKKFKGNTEDTLLFLSLYLTGFNLTTNKPIKLYEEFKQDDYKGIYLLFFEGIQHYDFMKELFYDFMKELNTFIQSVINKGKENNEIKEELDTLEITNLIQVTIFGFFLLWTSVPNLDRNKSIIANKEHILNYMRK